MTATLTHYVTTEPVNAIKRPIVALDAGNRTTQWIDPRGNVRTIPSFVKILESWEDAEPDENSILVELFDKNGDRTSRFMLGSQAQFLKGKPAFEFDKVELAKYLMFAALQPQPGQNTLIVDQLRVCLPDTRHQDSIKKLKELANTYEFVRNGNERIYCTIHNVQPVDETKPAYRWAIANNLFKSPKSINGILDLGGGTSIARLYTPSGSPIRGADINISGTFELASKINSALLPITNQSQDLSLIMDAIADGSYTIGSAGANFFYCFEKCRDSWLEEIRAKLRIAWGKYFTEVGEVLIIGGSAPLAKPIEQSTNGRFKVIQNSQEISIKGMIL